MKAYIGRPFKIKRANVAPGWESDTPEASILTMLTPQSTSSLVVLATDGTLANVQRRCLGSGTGAQEDPPVERRLGCSK